MVFDKNASWGKVWVYEAKGCNYGVVHNTRSLSWGTCTVAKRKSLVEGECNPGQTQSADCGKCGTKKRTCCSNGNWGSWGGSSGQGPCSPGQTQTQDWGKYGKQDRSCKSNCNWGGWGGCTGQGPCSPGQQQTEACGDCGSRGLSCGGDCKWSGWGGCAGPDPEGGNKWCDYGELGVCAEGRVRCLEGWIHCVALYEPSPELCDGLDNDCEGKVDNGAPLQLGAVPPPYAAQLVDMSFPKGLSIGQSGTAWAEFLNVGLETWPANAVFLAAGQYEGSACPLYAQGEWPAWDIPAALHSAVPPVAVIVRCARKPQFPHQHRDQTNEVLVANGAVTIKVGVALRNQPQAFFVVCTRVYASILRAINRDCTG